MIKFEDYRSILCLNGCLPDASFFDCQLPIIAADGAANKLIQMSIRPQIVIGDLDSVDPALLNQLKTYYHYDQDLCDFEKCLAYLKKNELLPTIVLGMNGGCIDHILNNVNHFLETSSIFYAAPLIGFTMKKNEDKYLDLALNTKISILGIPSALLSTTGLQWELTNSPLTYPGKNSCFNRTVQKTIRLNVHEGQILVFIYEKSF